MDGVGPMQSGGLVGPCRIAKQANGFSFSPIANVTMSGGMPALVLPNDFEVLEID